MPATFSSVPVLDYALLASPATRPEFIAQLQHALANVGFFYLANSPVAPKLFDAVAGYAPRFFNLPQAEKDAIAMINSPHFLGYSRLGTEQTKLRTDMREQFDFGSEYDNQWKEGDEDYLKSWGPPQWPKEESLPGFKDTLLTYISQVEKLGDEFNGLVCEALGVPPDSLSPFFSDPAGMQHMAKIVKYPTLDEISSTQGVGPHFDGGLLTFLFQASPLQRGLQVQNLNGEWIDVPPIANTFVVNIGKALETATQGLAVATSHRVVSPEKGSTPRYSIPFFQRIARTVNVSDVKIHFPSDILALKDKRTAPNSTDSVNYSEYSRGDQVAGKVQLIGRVKSHPEVGQRHYPELFKLYFPHGLPSHGSAY